MKVKISALLTMISRKPRDLEISIPRLPEFDSPQLQDKTTATQHNSWKHEWATQVSICVPIACLFVLGSLCPSQCFRRRRPSATTRLSVCTRLPWIAYLCDISSPSEHQTPPSLCLEKVFKDLPRAPRRNWRILSYWPRFA